MESYLTAEISASAVRSNLSLLRSRLLPTTRICAVVKADCYGHGWPQLLDIIAEKADCFAVATPEEAINLRRLGYDLPILMFFSACGYADGQELRDALDELVARRVMITVVSKPEADFVRDSAARVGQTALVHLKIDSGMTRSGVWPEGAPELVRYIRSLEGVRLVGAYTHFATSDEGVGGQATARGQLEKFLNTIDACGGKNGLTLHAANSAGVIDIPEAQLDMVRPGLAVYGYQPSNMLINRLPLRPALRLTGWLMQVKDVPVGNCTSYGLTYKFTRPSRIGLVPVGYGDGYLRCLSNKAVMMVRGRPAPVRGRVCMDQVVVDVTEIPEASVGDEVEIYSPDPTASNSVENLARIAETIPYELICRLGKRIRRKLVK